MTSKKHLDTMLKFSDEQCFRFRKERKHIQDYLQACEDNCNLSYWIGFSKRSPRDIAKKIQDMWLEKPYQTESHIVGHISPFDDSEQVIAPLKISCGRYSVEDGLSQLPYFCIAFGSVPQNSVIFSKTRNSPSLNLRIGKTNFDMESLTALYAIASGYIELNKRAS